MKKLHVIFLSILMSCGYSSSPGSKALSILDSKAYERLIVEIHYSSSSAFPGIAVRDVFDELNRDILNFKQIRYDISPTPIPRELIKKQYTKDDIILIENKVRKYFFDIKTRTATIYIVYLEGDFIKEKGESNKALGVAYSGSSIVIFKNKLNRICSPKLLSQKLNAEAQDHLCTFIEANILVHEVGHLLGLVNQTVPMIEMHEDREHPGHDLNKDCIMHYKYDPTFELMGALKLAIEKHDPNQAIMELKPSSFCDQCKKDLKFAKSKFAD